MTPKYGTMFSIVGVPDASTKHPDIIYSMTKWGIKNDAYPTAEKSFLTFVTFNVSVVYENS